MTRTRSSLLVLVVAVALAVGLATREGPAGELSLTVPAAANLVIGQEVRVARDPVGVVTDLAPVDRGRAARVTMRIDDREVWPLPRDSRIEIRFGGTASFSNRYLLLTPGTSGAVFGDGDAIPTAQVKTPVEIDDLIATFRAPLRRDLRASIDASGRALERAESALEPTLRRAPSVLDEAGGLLGDLTADVDSLESLVASTARVVGAVDRSTPELRTLLSGAGATLDAVADEADGLGTTLDGLPGALRQTRSTLGRADRTLAGVRELIGPLRPTVRELRRTIRPLDRVFTALEESGPDARAALASVAGGSRDVTSLLGAVEDLSPRLASVGRRGDEVLRCVRPYSPEIMLLTSTWGDYMTPTDGKDRFIRATVQSYMPGGTNSQLTTPADAAALHPGLTYGFPRPPGLLAGQPWFLPECGAGRDAIDPSKDKEAQTFGPVELPPEDRERRRGG